MRRPYVRIQFQLTFSVFLFTAICLATLAAAIYTLSENTLLKLQRDNLDLACELRRDEVMQFFESKFWTISIYSFRRDIVSILSDPFNTQNLMREKSSVYSNFGLNEELLLKLYLQNGTEILTIHSDLWNASSNASNLLPIESPSKQERNRSMESLMQYQTELQGPVQVENAIVQGKSSSNELLSLSVAVNNKGLTPLVQDANETYIVGLITVIFSAKHMADILRDTSYNSPKSYIGAGILCMLTNDSRNGQDHTLTGILPEINVSISEQQLKNASTGFSPIRAEVVDTPKDGKLLTSITRLYDSIPYFVALRQQPKGFNAMPNALRDIILITVFSIAGGMLIFSLLGASFGSRQILRLKMATRYEKPSNSQWTILPWWLQPRQTGQAQSVDSDGKVPENVPFRSHLRDELDDIARRFNEMSNNLVAQYTTLEEHVNKRKEEIESARLAANDANNAKSHFLARITHELRTPLNGILGTATLCLEDDNVDQIHQSLRTIFKCGELLLHLMTDLLSFSENEVENVKLDDREFTMSEIGNQLTAIFTEQCSLKDIHFVLEIEPNTREYVLHGDTNRILQIIFNLISNALKFTPAGGRLVFRAKMTPNDYDIRLFTFEVEDTGPGIAPHLQQRIFEEFVQGDIGVTSRRAGVGLGLYICQHLAERMGGSIQLKSELGKGSLFIFNVPIRVVKARESTLNDMEVDMYPDCELYTPTSPSGYKGIDFSSLKNPQSPPVERPGFSRSKSSLDKPLSNLRVLVADDNNVNQEVMKRMLNLEGLHSIAFASDGFEAFEKTKKAAEDGNPFDIIFMDVQMPNMDGRQASRQIRDELHYEGSIVAVSAFANEENADGCIEAGMNLFLTKPLRRPHLCQILHGLENTD